MKKLGTMLPDISRSLFKKPVTEQYPFVKSDAPENLRGLLHWDQSKCTGCGLCAMDCPAFAIQTHIIDRKTKRFVFEYHIDRCTFCGQCVESCRQDSLEMSSQQWELAALTRNQFVTFFGDPQDVERFLADKPQDDSKPAK